VTASRPTEQPLDQAVFGITVNSAADQSLDDVIKALVGSGITASNLTQLYSYDLDRSKPLTWNFQWIVQLDKTKTASASLTALQKTIAQTNPKLSLSFQLSTATSPSNPQGNCDLSALVAEARSKAQEMAGAGGFAVGSVAGIAAASRDSTLDCSLTVTFALGFSGRPGPHTISIAASRTAAPPQDHVSIPLTLHSTLSFGLDDVTAALGKAGITGATFTGVATDSLTNVLIPPNAQRILGWSFSQIVPLSKLNETLTLTAGAQQAILKLNGGLDLTYRVDGLIAARQATPVCRQADLISDAKTQAQKVANAAGVSVGSILSLTDVVEASGVNAYVFGPVASRLGAVIYTGFPAFVVGPPASASAPCAATVQFQMY
jgi:hypothetical protein